MSTVNTTDKHQTRVLADWRLPNKLKADMEAGGGLPDDRRSEQWQSNLRAMLDDWAAGSGRVEYSPADAGSRMCNISVNCETIRKLKAEAKRLSKLTGKEWSVAAVVRAVWEQER